MGQGKKDSEDEEEEEGLEAAAVCRAFFFRTKVKLWKDTDYNCWLYTGAEEPINNYYHCRFNNKKSWPPKDGVKEATVSDEDG